MALLLEFLLQIGGISGLGLSSLQAATPTQSAPKAKACIFIFLWGGPAQQDTLDPKPDAPVEYRGEFSTIQTALPGIRVCEHLPGIAKRLDRVSMIRSMTHTDVNHTTAPHLLLTGQPMLNQGRRTVRTEDDGWTVVTCDGQLSAQFEHTVAVTRQGVRVLTLRPGEAMRA